MSSADNIVGSSADDAAARKHQLLTMLIDQQRQKELKRAAELRRAAENRAKHPIHERTKEYEERKKLNLLKIEQEALQSTEKECTYRPNINKKSLEIAAKRGKTHNLASPKKPVSTAAAQLKPLEGGASPKTVLRSSSDHVRASSASTPIRTPAPLSARYTAAKAADTAREYSAADDSAFDKFAMERSDFASVPPSRAASPTADANINGSVAGSSCRASPVGPAGSRMASGRASPARSVASMKMEEPKALYKPQSLFHSHGPTLSQLAAGDVDAVVAAAARGRAGSVASASAAVGGGGAASVGASSAPEDDLVTELMQAALPLAAVAATSLQPPPPPPPGPPPSHAVQLTDPPGPITGAPVVVASINLSGMAAATTSSDTIDTVTAVEALAEAAARADDALYDVADGAAPHHQMRLTSDMIFGGGPADAADGGVDQTEPTSGASDNAAAAAALRRSEARRSAADTDASDNAASSSSPTSCSSCVAIQASAAEQLVLVTAQHEAAIAHLKAEHAAEMSQLKSQNDEAVQEAARKPNKAQLDHLRGLSEQLVAVEAERARLFVSEASARREVEQCRAALEAARSAASDREATLRQQLEASASEIMGLSSRITQLETEISAVKTRAHQHASDVTAACEAEIDGMRRSHLAEVAALRAAANAAATRAAETAGFKELHSPSKGGVIRIPSSGTASSSSTSHLDYSEILDALAAEVSSLRTQLVDSQKEARKAGAEARKSEIALADASSERDSLRAERSAWTAQLQAENGQLQEVMKEAHAAKDRLVSELSALASERQSLERAKAAFAEREAAYVHVLAEHGIKPPSAATAAAFGATIRPVASSAPASSSAPVSLSARGASAAGADVPLRTAAPLPAATAAAAASSSQPGTSRLAPTSASLTAAAAQNSIDLLRMMAANTHTATPSSISSSLSAFAQSAAPPPRPAARVPPLAHAGR